MAAAPETPTPLVRVIARLSFGGAPTQAIALTRLLEPDHRTALLTGVLSPGEEEMTDLLRRYGVVPERIPHLRREIGAHDLPALRAVRTVVDRERPAVVHTHASKGGALGRIAARTARHRPPVVVHTFHGHALSGYFSPRGSAVYREVERALARISTCLVAVSPQVRDELLAEGVGREDQYRVIEDGFDLEPFLVADGVRERERSRVRAELGVADDEVLVTLIARLQPIKRVDRFLRIVARLAGDPRLRFAIVGDGALTAELRAQAAGLGLGERVTWTGFRADVPALCFATDVLALTSDNEGAPVSLIEAQAAAVPVVATDVGGTGSVMLDGRSGHLVARDDEAGFASRVAALAADVDRRRALGAAGREHVAERFSTRRLVRQTGELYAELLERAASRRR